MYRTSIISNVEIGIKWNYYASHRVCRSLALSSFFVCIPSRIMMWHLKDFDQVKVVFSDKKILEKGSLGIKVTCHFQKQQDFYVTSRKMEMNVARKHDRSVFSIQR